MIKALIKNAGLFLFNLGVAVWGIYRLSDSVFTGIEFLQTALVLINLFGAAYYGGLLSVAWKAYREKA